jgi:hypothetical protein
MIRCHADYMSKGISDIFKVIFQNLTQTVVSINPSKQEANLIYFQDLVRTSQKPQRLSITKANWLMLFSVRIVVILRNIWKT